jgi:hypothetical protein
MSGDGARSSGAMQRLAGAARSNLAAFLVLRANARITSHWLKRRCGARTPACSVGTLADARCSRAERRRVETRRSTQECVRHGSRCAVILAWHLTALNLSISPERFDGVVPVLHRENGDAIYSVLPLGTSLAHVLQPAELVPLRPPGKFAYSDLLKYARAAGDAARPAAAFAWLSGNRARIRANLRPADLLSVQVAWFPGWKAAVHGEPRPVSADGMGFLVIQPRCQGDCEIDLAWTGRGDLLLAAVVSLATLALLAALAYRRRSAM